MEVLREIVNYAWMMQPVTNDHGEMELLEGVAAPIVVEASQLLAVSFVW